MEENKKEIVFMKTPLVSVIIPTYNRTDYLALTLKSVSSQTYKNIEIIVVDDGSPGNENKLLCDQFPHIHYLKIENSGGPSKPRNVGFKNSKGIYIAWLDDDDIWLPEKIEEQVRILEENQDFGLVHSYCKVIDKDGNLTGEIIGKPGSPDVKHGDVKLRMVGNWTLMMPTPLLRKSLIEKVGLFNQVIPGALADVEYWVRCSFYTKIYYMDELLVHYRQHSGNISGDKKKYLELPLYLKIVLDKVLGEKLINVSQHVELTNNLVRMQLKNIRICEIKTISNLNKLDPFWFIKFGNIKLLIKKLII